MDQSYYKKFITRRGFAYSYYFSPAAPNKPFFLFSHGFPSCSYLWRKQVEFFQPLGYGLIVPDLLGYGGTDKPSNPENYIGSGHAQDIIDILDEEGVEKVIGVGHDWGSRVVSRIANYYPDRLSACAFFAVGYGPPDSSYANPILQSGAIRDMVGYDILAYMHFFIEPDTAKVMEKNFDSFLSLLYPETPDVWKDNMCATGGAKAWIEGNKKGPLNACMTPDAREYYRKTLLGGGMSAPLCWYKVLVTESNREDDAKVPLESYNVNKPVLFVAFTRDAVAIPVFGDSTHAQYAKGPYTRRELAGDHWAVVTKAEELNAMLLEWTEGLTM